MTRNRTPGPPQSALLYRGVRSILRCDESEVVSGIAGFVLSQHRTLQMLSVFIERTTRTPIPATIALAGGVMSFLRVHPSAGRTGVVCVARRDNERRAIERLSALVPELEWNELAFAWPGLHSAVPCNLKRGLQGASRIVRFARRLHRRYAFFKVFRVIELIFYYYRYVQLLEGGRFSLAVTSNHSNPHGIAFNLAARRCGVPVMLVTHGMPVWPVAPLTFDLAVVHSQAASEIYQRAGCRMDRVLIGSRRKHSHPMPAALSRATFPVGVFLSKDTNEARFRRLMQTLLGDPRVSRILVRPHPTNLWGKLDAWLSAWRSPKVHLRRGRSVFEDLEECDFVFAGNSSVHVEAVTAGRPSCYVRGLDFGPPDLCAFVERRLIWELQSDTAFDPDEVLRFYQRPDWTAILRQFANVDQDEETVDRRVRTAMLELSGAAKRERNLRVRPETVPGTDP